MQRRKESLIKGIVTLPLTSPSTFSQASTFGFCTGHFCM
ncbi:rCG48909, isoform CRA_a [Rattus norvegicus]|uniref:RCG48909, isoform CRA_a n=1 Tax=Rattus norvegicus TaxID=10116 RepID=A6IFX4_RAT|nr:rCG48909, isoform CRA_a [Rattus norvegicus]